MASKITHRFALGSGVDELLTESLPILILRGLLDNNLLVVVRKLVDDELVLLVELELVEGSDALLRDARSVSRRKYVSGGSCHGVAVSSTSSRAPRPPSS